MIIFLYGSDTYRSHQKLNQIIEHYKKIHKSGLNLKYFDFKKDTFENFRDAFKSRSMFSEKKLIVLKNTFSDPSLEKKIEGFIEGLSKSKDIILFYEEEVDERKSLFKLLKKYGKSQKFELLEGFRLKNWVKKEFKKYSTEIDNKALNLLLDFVGNNLWQMENEVKKLVDYKNKNLVKAEDVRGLVRPKIEADIFETIEAMAEKDRKRALLLIKKHLEKGDPPSYLLAMIDFQFRNLLIIRDLIDRGKPQGEIFREAGLHPFVIKRTYPLAKKFKLEELKKIHQKIFEADLEIKTGKIEPGTALEMLTVEI